MPATRFLLGLNTLVFFIQGLLLVLELFEDAVLDVFAELLGDGEHDGLEVLALVEGIDREADEESVFAVHYTEATDIELVVEDDGSVCLDVAEARRIPKKINLTKEVDQKLNLHLRNYFYISYMMNVV